MSVLIASYNHAEFIGEAIESIWAQPYRNIEIVVVDDGSSDGSAKLLETLRERSPLPFTLKVNPQNRGVTRTLNAALTLAKGSLVTALGSDDRFAEDRFGGQIAAFDENPDLKAAFGECRNLSGGRLKKITGPAGKGALLAKSPEKILHGLYTHKSPFMLQGALMKTDFVREIGGFDEDLLSDDWPLVIRIFEKVKSSAEYCYTPDVVAHYRVHNTNSFKNLDRHSQLKLEVIGKYTPEALKPEAYANAHYIISRWALAAQNYQMACRHFFLSQRHGFDLGRLRFIPKLCWVVLSGAFRPLTTSRSLQGEDAGRMT